MAWNQPDNGNSKPPGRSARDASLLDETLKRWQQRLQPLWRPGANRGATITVLLLLIIGIWLATGFYEIDSAERGVVQRFGRYVATVGPGRGWHWPRPVAMVTKVNVGAIQSVDARSLMLTSDLDLLNVSWSVQYRRNDPLQVLFQLRDVQAVLQQDAEAALRRAVAAMPMDRVIAGDSRRRMAQQVRASLQKTLDGELAGLVLEAVNVTDVRVPDEVASAQRDVNTAEVDANRALKEAQGYANDIGPKAQMQVAHERDTAQAYKAQVTATADGDAQRFTALAAAYAQSPEVTRNRLYIDTVKTILARSHKIIIDTKTGSGNMIYLPLDKLLHSDTAAPSGAENPAQSGESAPATPPTPGSAAGAATDSGAAAQDGGSSGAAGGGVDEPDRSRVRGGR